jgi:hypothetical protein
MGWADDLAAAAPASAPTGWADQLSASKAPAPAAAAPAGSWWDRALAELTRQAGLTARAGVTGVTGLPALVGNGLNTAINYGSKGINALAGTSIPMLQMPTELVQQAENAAGLPQPKNATERVVQDAASSMAGVGGTYKLGQALLGSAAPMAQAAGRTLTAVPANQAIAAGSAGAAAGGAREAGLGPAWQFGAGLLGGVAGGVGSSLAGSALTKASRAIAPPVGNPAIAAPAVEAATSESPLPPSASRAQDLAGRTGSLIANNPGADPQAAARAADFRSLGMTPTLGQVTRDPGQFAQEQNWRGTPSGAPLLQRFNGQNQQLAQALRQTAGTGSTDLGDAQTIMDALKAHDMSLKGRVTQAYQDAAASTGSQLDVPLQGLAQDYAGVLQRFGDRVPSGVRNSFEALGLNSGTQRRVFSVSDAEDLLKTINQNQSVEPATNLALKQLGDSVKQAVLGADDQGGAFAPARALAAQRFALHDQVPALEASVYGNVAPDDFVRRFVTNGNASDVAGMAGVLRQSSPAGLKALQGQVGNKLQMSAFGQNMAGDKVFTPERYAQALNQTFGPDVLKSIYGPDQLDDLNAIGRVGSYINSEPAFSPVNRSNTGSAILDMLHEVPLIGGATSALARKAMIARALRGDLSDTGAVAPSQANQLGTSLLLGGARPVPVPQPGGQP